MNTTTCVKLMRKTSTASKGLLHTHRFFNHGIDHVMDMDVPDWIKMYLTGGPEWQGVYPMFIDAHLSWPVEPKLIKPRSLGEYEVRMAKAMEILQEACAHWAFVAYEIAPNMLLFPEWGESIKSGIAAIAAGMIELGPRPPFVMPGEDDLRDVRMQLSGLRRLWGMS